MTREDIIAAASLIWDKQNWTELQGNRLVRFANLMAFMEREEIAKMFDEPMRLVPFVQNHHGGCMICGFTPKHAAKAIRARTTQ